MNIVIGTVIIWIGAVMVWRALETPDRRRASFRGALALIRFTLPRISVALVGAGLFAELLPRDQVREMFGQEAGLQAVLLAALFGPVTPGGAFVSFAIGAGAIKAGAGTAAVMAYVTSWALFSMTRMLAYELPLVGRQSSLIRLGVVWPVPFVVGTAAWLLIG